MTLKHGWLKPTVIDNFRINKLFTFFCVFIYSGLDYLQLLAEIGFDFFVGTVKSKFYCIGLLGFSFVPCDGNLKVRFIILQTLSK